MRAESTPGARGPVFCGVDTHADSHWLCVLDVSVNLFFTSFAKQAHRSRKGGFTGCANVFSPIPVTA